MPDIAWPIIPVPDAARQLALQYQFRQTERWSAEQIRAYQFTQLRHMLTHADRTMPFWRRRLRAVGIEPGTELTEEVWARIPILSRTEAQDAGSALHCLSVPPAHGAVNPGETSGSSGTPLRLVRTDLYEHYYAAGLLRDLLGMGADFRAKMAMIRRNPLGEDSPGKGRRLRDWGPAVASVFPTGPAAMFEIRRPVPEQAAWLLREDPDYLLTFPSVLQQLALHFRETGQKLKRLRRLRTIAEVVTPDLRALCHEVFGVGITDSYTCEEAGYLALQCPHHEHLHLLPETVLTEVLDEAGRPCSPGQVGRVVVTPLHNFAMPLLRYDLGDLAELGPPCDCGRTAPVLRRILGRARNLVILPSGEKRLAYFAGSDFYPIRQLRQFQVIQTSRDTIEFRLVTRGPLGAETEARMVQRLGEMLGHHFETTLVYVDAIDPEDSGKFVDFKSRIL